MSLAAVQNAAICVGSTALSTQFRDNRIGDLRHSVGGRWPNSEDTSAFCLGRADGPRGITCNALLIIT
jgi:hypothetical protein